MQISLMHAVVFQVLYTLAAGVSEYASEYDGEDLYQKCLTRRGALRFHTATHNFKYRYLQHFFHQSNVF